MKLVKVRKIIKNFMVKDIDTNFEPEKEGYGILPHKALVIAYFDPIYLKKPPLTKSEILELTKSNLDELGLVATDAFFYEHAGCASIMGPNETCTCRPGYCIEIDGIPGGLNRITMRIGEEII